MATKSALKRKLKALNRQQSLMRISVPPARPWQLNDEEVALVKNHIAKGATDDELKFCLAVARRFKLDPFRGQIWFVKRRDRSAEGGYRWIPIVGINGLQHVAVRDHADYGTADEPEFGPMHDVSYRYNGDGPVKKFHAPEWARVAVWKKGGARPTQETVYWDEIYPNVDYSPMCRQMPRRMLAKCARAASIRMAYPGTDGLYLQEEIQGRPEFTQAGRVIEYETPEQEAEHNPSLKRYIESETHTPAQQEVIARRLEELKSSAKPETPQPSPTIPSEPLDKYHDVKMLLAEADTAEKMNALCEALRDGVNDENIKAFVRARAGALRLTWDGKARQWK